MKQSLPFLNGMVCFTLPAEIRRFISITFTCQPPTSATRNSYSTSFSRMSDPIGLGDT